MTSAEPKQRRPGRPKSPTLEQDLLVSRDELEAQASILSFPCVRYQRDIIGFARDVMGFTPCFTLDELVTTRDDEDARGVPEHERRPCLWPKQIEILIAVQDNRRVAVSSGHKIGKSHTAAILALWFYSCFADAKIVFSSTTYHQVKTILWDEFRKLRYRSAIFIPGDMHEMPNTGFISIDFRTVRGFTAKEPEAVAGISGTNLLFILDEASGIPNAIHEAVEGNRAGGAGLVMFSNPTKTSGTFFDAFNSKSAEQIGVTGFKTFQVSSEETPNAVTGRRLIPGLATKDYIESTKAEWGEESPFYKIRVKGLFCLNDDGKPFSLAAIQEAEARWFDPFVEGRLHIGVDPAGAGSNGDETAYAVRRGAKVLECYAKLGQTEEAILAELRGLLRKHRGERENGPDVEPVIAVDAEGPIGLGVYSRIKVHFDLSGEPSIFLMRVRASDKAQRLPHVYERVRDELVGSLERWLRTGAIPTDTKLEKDLNAFEWSSTITGKLKATSKDDLKKILGRSPDRADAIALSVWEPSAYRSSSVGDEAPAALPPPQPATMNPYAGMAGSSSSSGFDPYSGVR